MTEDELQEFYVFLGIAAHSHMHPALVVGELKKYWDHCLRYTPLESVGVRTFRQTMARYFGDRKQRAEDPEKIRYRSELTRVMVTLHDDVRDALNRYGRMLHEHDPPEYKAYREKKRQERQT